MSSRIRDNVQHLFTCFCEVVPPSENEKEPWIIQQYPEKYKDPVVLREVAKFAYPYKFENSVIQHYSFVLTDSDSKWTFGFCRHDPKSQTAIVVLSYLPWHQVFYKFLDNTAVLMHSSRTEDLGEFLSAVYNAKIGEPGRKFSVSFNRGQSTFSIDVPRPFELPSIPENRNLTEYFNAVDATNMMIIFASMLFERRIVFTSKQLKRLSACVQSANDIIYPMSWQHIFIPVLPMSLMEYLMAPMPFLIGVPEEVMKKVHRQEIGDIVLLNADTNEIETPFDDLNSLPQDVVNSLRKQLRNKSTLLGDTIPRAFLRALVQLIGGYNEALKFEPGKSVTFDEEKFIETRPVSLQPFMKQMLQLQIFQQFIEERLTMLNTGRGFSDEFEFELAKYSSAKESKLKQQYKEWTSSMKKEGSAFFKTVKEKVLNKKSDKKSKKSKANPAMKSAVKTVKDGGKGVKSAYKGIKSKLKDNPINLSNNGDSVKPRSAPSSPTSKRRGLSGLSMPVATYRKDASLAIKNASLQRSYSPLSPSSQPATPDMLDSARSGSPIDIPRTGDLMHELQDILKLRLETPPVDRSLKPVRSMENFKQASSPLGSPPDRWPPRSNPPPRPSLPFPQFSSPSNKYNSLETSQNSSKYSSLDASQNTSKFFPDSHLFSSMNHSRGDTQNLLQSPLDEPFLSPPLVPPRPHPNQTFFGGSGTFVVSGGQNENGVPVFYKIDKNQVDVVKLSPPKQCSPARRKALEDSGDLIRLDSNSDLDDFDPLKSPSSNSSYSTPTHQVSPLCVSNPLYNSSYENHPINANGSIVGNNFNSRDQDLLQEYGLNFNFSGHQNLQNNSSNQNDFDPFDSNSTSGSQCGVQNKGQWTKFE